MRYDSHEAGASPTFGERVRPLVGSAMSTIDFLRTCRGEVRIHLTNGATYTGHFRTDILGPTAVSAYFHGNERDISLPIGLVDSIEHIAESAIAS